MITFENHMFFKELLKNEKIIEAIIKEDTFGFGSQPASRTSPEPSKTPVSDQLAQQYRHKLLQGGDPKISLSELIKTRKQELLRVLTPFKGIHSELMTKLLAAIEQE